MPTSLIALTISEHKSLAEELKGGIAVPHRLVAWGRIMRPAEVAAQPGHEAHGVPKASEGRQPFF